MNPNIHLSDGSQNCRANKFQNPTILVIGILVFVALGCQFSLPGEATPDTGQGVGKTQPITPVARPLASGVAAGNPNARVRIDVYEDFQCPACRQYTLQTESQLMAKEIAEGKAYYVFHSFLIIDHATWSSEQKESHQAANAAMCAADQNRFWDYHDILFDNWTGENVGDFTDARLLAFARQIKLDMPRFTTCFNSNQFKNKIDADITAAQGLGVDGTPSVFVNGKQVSPGYIPSYYDINYAIDQATPK